MGVKAVKSHMDSNSHQTKMRGRNSQLPLSLFCAGTSATPTSIAPSTSSTVTTSTAAGTSTSPAPINSIPNQLLSTTATLQAEVLWCLDLASKHHSFNSNDGIAELFVKMFPDSQIAKSFALAKDKTGYMIKFGIAPYFKRQLVEAINRAGPYVLMFDESLNQSSKKKQLDIHIRFLEDGCVQSRYFGSQFLGHGRADDLLLHIKECIGQLNMRQLLSVGMDGPNVNFKLLDLLQREYAELNGGAQVLVVGSCGLHTLHNAMKAGFTVWQIEKFLRALHFLFHNVPARREDYTNTTGSTCFPLSFCGHRWVENVPVAERALEVWPMVQAYVSAAEEKKVQKPNTASYDTILAAREDPLLVPKLQFFISIARGFNPFLHKYQTDEPVLPFLAKDLTELLLSLLRRFIKRELLQDQTPLQLIKLDISDEKNWVSLRRVDIGLGAESAIKVMSSFSNSPLLSQIASEMRNSCPSSPSASAWMSSSIRNSAHPTLTC
ncbi:uncharacterized protein LOC134463795 [Engraulis encrasicolus]|uniref:uncharacterized protein LOC134463795 n=1 Tax=Engraulis encrasicolus TaxID=184585 RepID=UPI002FCF0BAC